MSLAQKMHFLQEVIQMTAIALVSVLTHYHINRLHLFWDTLYMCAWVCVRTWERERKRERKRGAVSSKSEKL